MTSKRRTRGDRARPVVHSEDFTSSVDELVTFARQRGEELRRRRGLEPVREEGRAETDDFLTDELRGLLEDEVVPAYPEDEGFRESEFHREVIKKALVGLRLEALRKVAGRHSLDTRGKSEDLAERIARVYGYDDHEIAQLILDNVEEPDVERGYESRVFPLRREVTINSAERELRKAEGRLVRTGVARWLAVDKIDRSDDTLSVAARVRSYSAFVQHLGEHATLTSAPAADKALGVDLTDGEPSLTVHNLAAYLARTAARAVAALINIPFTAGLPIGRGRTGHLAGFDDRTIVLLDLVHNRLPAVGVRDRNLTIARFVVDKSESVDSAAPEEATGYSLKAVRFEGNYLLSSPQACQLMAVHGRGLANIALWVSAPGLAADDGDPPWFPIKFSLERDHIGVVTGYGRQKPELAAKLHDALMGQVHEALNHGVADEDALENLAREIYATAKSGGDDPLGP